MSTQEKENCFAIANVLPGKLNALVKRAMSETGVDDPVEAVRLVNSGEWVIVKNQNGPALENVSGVLTLVREERFLAKEKFKLGKDGGIFFSFGHDFCEWFLSGEGKIEEPQNVKILNCFRVLKSLEGIELSHEIARKGQIELSLYDVFEVVSRQLSRDIGVLNKRGYNNLFYVPDQKDVLRVVSVRLMPGVIVDAYQLEVGWDEGVQVFCQEILD